MQPFYYVLTLVFLFGTPLIIFTMKYLSSAYQARAKAQADDAYRELAQKAVGVQADNGTALAAMRVELSQIGERLTAVEKILKAVE